jgi:hypothetical protein
MSQMSILKLMVAQTPVGAVLAGPTEERKDDRTNINGNLNDDAITAENALYVATDLEAWKTSKPHRYAWQFNVNRTWFRRLDPKYFAWLEHQMMLADRAVDAGNLSESVFRLLHTRFNRIYAWAVKQFGEERLRSAASGFEPRTYSPPPPGAHKSAGKKVKYHSPAAGEPKPNVSHLYPKNGKQRFAFAVSAAAVAKVDAIREKAAALGWSEASLYQNRGRLRMPYGKEYGAVCFLDEDIQIGEVTKQSIELVRARRDGSCLRFYNPELDRPWKGKARHQSDMPFAEESSQTCDTAREFPACIR